MKSTNSYTDMSFDDVIFEKRNREYGAYKLRQEYSRYLLLGFIAAVIVAIVSAVTPLLIYNKKPKDIIYYPTDFRYIDISADRLDDLPNPLEEIYLPSGAPAPRMPEPEDMNEIIEYAVPEIVDTLIPIEEWTQIVEDVLVNENDSLVEYNYDDDILYYADDYDFGLGDGSGRGLGDGVGEGAGSPFLIVEVMPSFRNGTIDSFRQWVQQQIVYPHEAIEQNIQGRVIFTFVVETDGSVSNVNIVKSLAPIIDEEVVRVINSSPTWSPGSQEGRAVRVRFSMSLNFLL